MVSYTVCFAEGRNKTMNDLKKAYSSKVCSSVGFSLFFNKLTQGHIGLSVFDVLNYSLEKFFPSIDHSNTSLLPKKIKPLRHSI